jgi:hypothetical protein
MTSDGAGKFSASGRGGKKENSLQSRIRTNETRKSRRPRRLPDTGAATADTARAPPQQRGLTADGARRMTTTQCRASCTVASCPLSGTSTTVQRRTCSSGLLGPAATTKLLRLPSIDRPRHSPPPAASPSAPSLPPDPPSTPQTGTAPPPPPSCTRRTAERLNSQGGVEPNDEMHAAGKAAV